MYVCYLACSLVRWDFVHTLEIINRILSEVVNRERLCGTSAFYFGVLLCFIEPIVGNREPGVLNRGHRISLNHHLNYVAGSTRPHPPQLRTDPATNAVDNQGQALAAPCLGRSNGSFGIISEGVE